jgi:cytochrome c551/c552
MVMILNWLFAALLGILMVWALPAHAFSADDLEQLVSTRACVGCDLQDVDLRGANLSRVNLEQANLSRANLMAVDLSGANLQEAVLDEALMYAVNLSDANLRGVSVYRTALGGAYVCNTTIPSGRISNRDCDAENELIDPEEDESGSMDALEADLLEQLEHPLHDLQPTAETSHEAEGIAQTPPQDGDRP